MVNEKIKRKEKITIIYTASKTTGGIIFQIRITICNSLWLRHTGDYSHDSLINTPDHSWDTLKILQTF